MEHIYILIHGTWSDHRGNWSLPQGDFFQAFSLCIPPGGVIVPFLWSGKNNTTIRKYTAAGLAQLIKSYPLTTQIHIIAHSHGANIAFLASQRLADEKVTHKITSFFALGTPINTHQYSPNITVIQKGWNLFSTKDTVQPIFGRFSRMLDQDWNFYNIRLFLDNQEPEHFQLHSPLIAPWIAQQIHGSNDPLSLYNELFLFTNKQSTITPLASFENTAPKGLFYTVSTAFKLVHYKAKSIKRSRLQQKKALL